MVFGAFTRLATQQSARAAVRTNSRSASTAASAFEAQVSGRGVSALASRRASQQQQHPLPKHYANDVTGIVAGVAIVGAIVGVGKMWWDASSTPSGKKYPVAFEEIPQKDVAKFFSELIANVQALFVSADCTSHGFAVAWRWWRG